MLGKVSKKATATGSASWLREQPCLRDTMKTSTAGNPEDCRTPMAFWIKVVLPTPERDKERRRVKKFYLAKPIWPAKAITSDRRGRKCVL